MYVSLDVCDDTALCMCQVIHYIVVKRVPYGLSQMTGISTVYSTACVVNRNQTNIYINLSL